MARVAKHNKRFSRVYVEEDKITKYLLNEEHPIGKGKASFFISMGFSSNSPGELSSVLSNHPKTAELERELTTDWGTKYIFVCNIMTPNHNNVCLVSVWQIDNQTTTPRFVTAYPNKNIDCKPSLEEKSAVNREK